jgi:hypothetical protein
MRASSSFVPGDVSMAHWLRSGHQTQATALLEAVGGSEEAAARAGQVLGWDRLVAMRSGSELEPLVRMLGVAQHAATLTSKAASPSERAQAVVQLRAAAAGHAAEYGVSPPKTAKPVSAADKPALVQEAEEAGTRPSDPKRTPRWDGSLRIDTNPDELDTTSSKNEPTAGAPTSSAKPAQADKPYAGVLRHIKTEVRPVIVESAQIEAQMGELTELGWQVVLGYAEGTEPIVINVNTQEVTVSDLHLHRVHASQLIGALKVAIRTAREHKASLVGLFSPADNSPSPETGQSSYEFFQQLLKGDPASTSKALDSARQLRDMGWRFEKVANVIESGSLLDRDEKLVRFDLTGRVSAADWAEELALHVGMRGFSPPKRLLSLLYPKVDWARVRPDQRQDVVRWITEPSLFGDDAQAFESSIAPSMDRAIKGVQGDTRANTPEEVRQALLEAAKQLGLPSVSALRRQFGDLPVVGPGVIAHHRQWQSSVIRPLAHEDVLEAFMPFARGGWVIDRGEGFAKTQTGFDAESKRILMSDAAWEDSALMQRLLPGALAKARDALAGSDLKVRHPHLKWDVLSIGALKALSAWQQRGFDAGKHPGVATQAAKALGFSGLDALKKAMQAPVPTPEAKPEPLDQPVQASNAALTLTDPVPEPTPKPEPQPEAEPERKLAELRPPPEANPPTKPNTGGPLAARVKAFARMGVAQTPLLLDVKDRAVELAEALDRHNETAAADRRIDLDVEEALSLALYRRAATLARKPDGSPELRLPALSNQYSEATQKALSLYMSGSASGADVPKLAMSALRKVYLAQHPNNDFPKTFIPRALASLDAMLGRTEDIAVADPAKQSALAGIGMLVESGHLSKDAAQSVLEELGLGKLALASERNSGSRSEGDRTNGGGWSLPREDIRDYPVNLQSAAQLAQERRKSADALVSALGAVVPTQAGALAPESFLFNVGLRALREGHAGGVAQLMNASWRSGVEPTEPQIKAALFTGMQEDQGYVRAVVDAYVREVRDCIRLALDLRRQPGHADTRLTPMQASAALRLENKALEAFTAPAGVSPQRYLLSLPQANDNRRAAFAALARIGRDSAFSTGVVVWTTSKFLAEGAVPEEARAALGDRFEIVDSTAALVDRAAAPGRKRPLLAVLGDDALASQPEQVAALVKRLGARRLVLVADEAQRLSTGSSRVTALAPLAARADVTMALSATPVGRNADDLGRLGQTLGLLPLGALPRDPRALYTAMAPHFMAGGAQRPAPTLEYLTVPYSKAGFEMQRYLAEQPGVNPKSLQVLQTQNGIDEKLDVIAARTRARVQAHGKVIIGSSYKAEGIERIAAKLGHGDTAGPRVGLLDGSTSVAKRREALRRFKLPAGDANALDVLVTTFNAAQGDTAVDAVRPPAGGFEVIAADVPSTPVDVAALTGLVNQEELPAEVQVHVTIPVVRFTDDQRSHVGKTALTVDESTLRTFRDRDQKAAGATGTRQGSGGFQPTASQLSRYALGRGYRGMDPGYFPGIDQLIAYMEANERPGPWQQATQYLQDKVRETATAWRTAGKPPRLLDLGSGYNYLVTRAIADGLVAGNDAYGIDQIPASAMTQLVERGKLGPGSDTHHLQGQIENAPQVLKAALGSDRKFNIATSSFSLMGRDPALIASYFRAANTVLETGGRFLIVHPLSSFQPQRSADFERGLKQMGFRLVRDRQLDTVGAPVRYLELERTGDPVADVNAELFRLDAAAPR